MIMYFDDELCNLLANPDENRSELMTGKLQK